MLRLTKQQKSYQESVLLEYKIADIFKPSSNLVATLARAYLIERDANFGIAHQLDELKSKSLWRIFRERYF